MKDAFSLPDDLHEYSHVHRVLRLDEHWRYATAGFFLNPATGRKVFEYSQESNIGAINIVLQGRGTFTNRSGETSDLYPGCFFQRVPDQAHTTQFESNYIECFVSLEAHTFRELLALHLLENWSVVDIGINQMVLQEFWEVRGLLQTTEAEIASPLVLIYVLQFFQRLYNRARHLNATSSSLSTRIGLKYSGVVAAACRILEQDTTDRTSIEQIAKDLGVSYPTLRRVFRFQTGMSPREYRIRQRIERACGLLMTNSVQQTATQLGYSDPFTFSAQFKNIVGVSPRTFQQQQSQR